MRIESALKVAAIGIMCFLAQGCGTLIQNQVTVHEGQTAGYVELTLDDRSRFAAAGWTLSVSETIDGKNIKYGFIGRDMLWAPFGYTAVRRIPLATGLHMLQLAGRREGGISSETTPTVPITVMAGKVVPILVSVDHIKGNEFKLIVQTGSLTDP